MHGKSHKQEARKFDRISWNSNRQSPCEINRELFGRGSINGDFDFFGESHGFTPKTPMYILELCVWVFFFFKFPIQ